MAKKCDPQYVINLGNRLMKAKADVKVLQAEWDALFASTNDTQSGPKAVKTKAPTLVRSIINLLEANEGHAFPGDMIATVLKVTNKQSMATTLSKLVRRGVINKYGANCYTSILSPAIGVITSYSGASEEASELKAS